MTADDVAAAKRTRARLSEHRRGQIFDAAIRLVAEHGYQLATIEAIADAASASKATLYRHWSDKPTLVLAAFADRSGIDLHDLDTGSVASDLRGLMRMLAGNAAQNVTLLLTLTHAGQLDPRLRDAVQNVFTPQMRALEAMLDRAARRGEIPPGRGGHVVQMVVGALFTPVFLGGDIAEVSDRYLQDYLRDVIHPHLGIPSD